MPTLNPTLLNLSHPELQLLDALARVAHILPRKFSQHARQFRVAAPGPEGIIGAVGFGAERVRVGPHHRAKGNMAAAMGAGMGLAQVKEFVPQTLPAPCAVRPANRYAAYRGW